jgi:hypothetical protein
MSEARRPASGLTAAQAAGIAIALVPLLLGLGLRHWLWSASAQTLRFPYDIDNAWIRGSRVCQNAYELAHPRLPPPRHPRLDSQLAGQNPSSYPLEGKITWPEFFRGYLADYDWVAAHAPPGRTGPQYGLDYGPLRLLIVSAWVKHAHDVDPLVTRWNDTVAEPLIEFNTFCEFSAAVAVFLLVWIWMRRAAGAWPAPWVRGLFAASLLWLNPAMLLDSHAWPQWEVWIIPLFLFAAILILLDWGLAAGVLIAVGWMAKGQLALVSPIFILWPLFQGRFALAGKIFIGFAAGFSVLAVGWLTPTVPNAWPMVWVIGAIVAILAIPLFVRDTTGPIRTAILMALSITLLAWPWARPMAILVAAAVATILLLLTRRGISASALRVLAAGAIAAAIWIAFFWFGGSAAWWNIGFQYGTRHFPILHIGSTNNLANLLGDLYHWRLHEKTLPLHFSIKLGNASLWTVNHTLDLRELLICVYVIALLICSFGAALQARRRDPHLLVALAAPWVLMFALLPQMHERYLVWAAAITALGAGVSLGLTFLHLLITAIAASNVLLAMLGTHPDFLPHLREGLERTQPGLGWLTLLIAAIYLYVAVTPARKAPVPLCE